MSINESEAPLGRCDFCPADAAVVWRNSLCPQLDGKRTCDLCSIAAFPWLLDAARRVPRPRRSKRKRSTTIAGSRRQTVHT
jgi:hypothetical protein